MGINIRRDQYPALTKSICDDKVVIVFGEMFMSCVEGGPALPNYFRVRLRRIRRSKKQKSFCEAGNLDTKKVKPSLEEA